MPEGVPQPPEQDLNLAAQPVSEESYGGDLPADFDPSSEAQVRNLSNPQIEGVLESAHEVHELAAGFSDDVAAVLLNPGDFRPDADPAKLATTKAILRELVRRAVQMPEWELTQEYLFGEEQ